MADSLQRSFANAAADRISNIVDDFVGSLTDVIGDALSNVDFGGGGGFGDFFSNLLSFQSGGIVPGAGNEPRLILAHAGEVVLNRQQQQGLLSSLGGGGVAININNTQADDVDVTAESRSLPNGDRVIDIAVQASLQRQSDSGEIDPLFGGFGGRRQLVSRSR